MKALFLHGWCSDGFIKSSFLRGLGYEVNIPKLNNWFFRLAVRKAQRAYDLFRPDVVIGSSRGGAVAMNIDTDTTPLVLLAPSWKMFGRAKATKQNAVIIHSHHDTMVSHKDSVDLKIRSGCSLISAGMDHRLNDRSGQEALVNALRLLGFKHDLKATKVPMAISLTRLGSNF
jgi:hypothetical protein